MISNAFCAIAALATSISTANRIKALRFIFLPQRASLRSVYAPFIMGHRLLATCMLLALVGRAIAAAGTDTSRDYRYAAARQALFAVGTRYHYGGSSPETGFDCSGLVAHVYQRAWGVELGVHDRRHGADRAELGAAFDAEQVRLAWQALVEARAHWRQVARARHAIVHQRPRQELAALGVVHGLLVQRLPGALRHAAVHLPLDDHVVDDAADVVAAREARDPHLARLAVDLHFARLHAIRPRWRRRCLGRRHPEELARLSCRELAERERAIGARDAKAPVAVLNVGRRRFQRLGRERLALADYPPAR